MSIRRVTQQDGMPIGEMTGTGGLATCRKRLCLTAESYAIAEVIDSRLRMKQRGGQFPGSHAGHPVHHAGSVERNGASEQNVHADAYRSYGKPCRRDPPGFRGEVRVMPGSAGGRRHRLDRC